MRNLIIFSLLFFINQSIASECSKIKASVENAKEIMGVLAKKRVTKDIIEPFKKLIDNGFHMDTGFFQAMKGGGFAIPTKNFLMKTKKEGYKNSLDYHFKKHGKEFYPPIRSQKEYARRAKKFAAKNSDEIITISLNGPFMRYNPKTKEFIKIQDNSIGTYYIADLDYINKNSGRTYKSVEEWIYSKWSKVVLGFHP